MFTPRYAHSHLGSPPSLAPAPKRFSSFHTKPFSFVHSSTLNSSHLLLFPPSVISLHTIPPLPIPCPASCTSPSPPAFEPNPSLLPLPAHRSGAPFPRPPPPPLQLAGDVLPDRKRVTAAAAASVTTRLAVDWQVCQYGLLDLDFPAACRR